MMKMEIVEILEHDGVPVCEASVKALGDFMEAREELADEVELYYLETRMLECFEHLKGA